MERQSFNNSSLAGLHPANGSVFQVASAKSQQWAFLSIFSLVIFIVSLLANGTVLAVFARSTWLCTPFNVQVINLLAANMLSMLVQIPHYLVNSLHGSLGLKRVRCTYLDMSFKQVHMSGIANSR